MAQAVEIAGQLVLIELLAISCGRCFPRILQTLTRPVVGCWNSLVNFSFRWWVSKIVCGTRAGHTLQSLFSTQKRKFQRSNPVKLDKLSSIYSKYLYTSSLKDVRSSYQSSMYAINKLLCSQVTVQTDQWPMTVNQAIDWRNLRCQTAGWHFFFLTPLWTSPAHFPFPSTVSSSVLISNDGCWRS